MNDKFFKDEITVYHTEDDENYTNKHFKNVYFRHNKKTNVIDRGIENASTGTITIPTKDNINIAENDYLVEGNVKENFSLSSLQEKYQIFRVVSIDDNRKGGLPHWKIGVAD